jgi:hypothetical protein
VPARGSGWDAEDGTLPAENLDWKLEHKLPDDTFELIDDGEGPIVDFSPPANGFPTGDYRLTLTVADALGNEDSAERLFTIVADTDNDGMTDDEENAASCITYLGDDRNLDPLNAFRDDDGDGIPNVDDTAICTAATAFEAIVDVDADMVRNQPLGVLSGFVTLWRYRPITAVNGSTVRISSINGIPADIRSLRWSVDKNGVGISKFDKAVVIGFLNTNHIENGPVLITISGGGSYLGKAFTFEGSDLTTVH